jgi:hypothetical protein
MPLERIDGHWAGAWKRIRAGSPPFPARKPRPEGAPALEEARPRPMSPYVLLGVEPAASIEEVKAAFRKKALEHHPDRGGTTESFVRMKRAYDAIMKARGRPPQRSRRG